MAQPIEIIVSTPNENGSTSQEQIFNNENNQQAKGESVTRRAINTALVSAGKRIVSYSISQYGNLTGNTIAQRQIDDAMQIGSYITQIAVGGWVGAIAVGLQVATNGINMAISNARTNQQAQLLYERSGNITIDGGRGTND